MNAVTVKGGGMNYASFDTGPDYCPDCGAQTVWDNTETEVIVECTGCGRTWRREYALSIEEVTAFLDEE